jgi:hypothetical protein
MQTKTNKRDRGASGGRLRIGDDWNAIAIIALSQSNPLKAVAELVENSIDAQARHIVITRGKEHGEHYLAISDDGEGVPRNPDGIPDFRYVATHICDSVKRRLKAEGTRGLQGEFGIGLLSFWTVGEELTLGCAGADGKTYQMRMRRNDPGYEVSTRHTLFAKCGTELKIKPLLAGLRQMSGEKIQWYLAAELRDRIRQSGVEIRVVDRHSRKEYRVEPRAYTGRLLHALPPASTPYGDVYLELYLAEPQPTHSVALSRSGTRVLANLTELDAFAGAPWNTGYLQGIVDAAFLNLTPGTRLGVIRDERYEALCAALAPVAEQLAGIIEEQQRAEEERASRDVLHAIRRALQEALLALPAEEYDWFDVRVRTSSALSTASGAMTNADVPTGEAVETDPLETEPAQKRFFEFAGPLFSVRVLPAACTVSVNQSRRLSALARDRARHRVEENLTFRWEIIEGGGRLENAEGEIATFHAPAEPGLVRVRATATQGEVVCSGEGMMTITDSLLPETKESAATRQGLPDYTFERAPGALWRSRYDLERNVIVVNNGHRDFVYASRSRALKLRYLARLFAKELVLRNFPGQPAESLLERMIELSLYTEENLR